jgi:type VII secretion protein EccB
VASRQQQFQAYQLLTRRLVSALIRRDSDPDHSPSPGSAGAALAGVLVTVIVLGAAAAWGAYAAGPSQDWRHPDLLVVAEGTGARYVWRDGALHPVGSYTSALLVLGVPDPRTVTVPRAVLDDAPRGAPLGIPGTPDTLPGPDGRDVDGWMICSSTPTPTSTPTPASASAPVLIPVIGAAPTGTAVTPREAVLVEAGAGTHHLLWQHRRHRVRDDEVTLPALGWAGQQPVPVPEELMGALAGMLPSGPDLGRITVPGLGQPSSALPGAVAGEVVAVAARAGAPQYAVVLPGGLVPVTAVQADLVLTDPAIAAEVGAPAPRELSQAQFAALPRLDPAVLGPTAAGSAGLSAVPALVAPAGDELTVCAVVADPGAAADLLLDVALPPAGRAARTAGRTAAGGPLVDLVVVPAGGVVVSAGGEVGVVTEQGVHHPVPPEAMAILGYADVAPLPLPSEVVSLLPSGPPLDPAVARDPDRSGVIHSGRSGLSSVPGSG